MPLTLETLLNAIRARDLPLALAVQLTPDVMAHLWAGEREAARQYFNSIARRGHVDHAPALEEILDAVGRGPNLVAVRLWRSYVGRGAPWNISGARVGLGWTKAAASKAAGHHSNQAPFEKFSRFWLVDQSNQSINSDEESLAWGALGWLEQAPSLTTVEETALLHLRDRRYASAWLTLYAPLYPPK